MAQTLVSAAPRLVSAPGEVARMADGGKLTRDGVFGGGRIARNTLWNLAATAAPMPVALIAVPILLRALGTERFGLLALSWTVIGYFTLFDLGLGRALTKLVAESLGQGSEAVPQQFWTALTLMSALGAAGAATLYAAANPLAHLLKVSPALQPEVYPATILAALALPTVTLTAGLRGYLEAHQRFALLGPIRAATGALLLLGPVAVLAYEHTLPAMLLSMVAVRLVSLAAHFAACIHVSPELWTARSPRWSLAAPLVKFGGWLTVTNIVSPLMVSMDRFLIGGQLVATEVAYYATPYEIVTKYLVLPLALTGVLFPQFSARPRGAETRRLYWKSLGALAAALAPLTLATVLLAKPALQWWVGREMAQHGYRVLQLLAVGVFLNAMAQVPFAFIQAAGRPDLTAKFHLLELPAYAAALWCGIHWWGIEGAAVAWVGRVAVDAGLLMWWSRSIPVPRYRRQTEPSTEPALV